MYWLSPIFSMSKMGKNYKRDVEIIRHFDKKVFKRKKEKEMQVQYSLKKETRYEEEPKMKIKQRIIDALLDLNVKHGLMSEEDVIRDMEGIIFAGYDTTAHTVMDSLFLGEIPRNTRKTVS
ncbi:uncharacterized protein LOC111641935 [Centruroides sculpturatus]|uniref:uncharacterized protein LOC111641935 n=1 Tax=Centruroides sculpturatus TaxID=218467 RepID=UPI000C6E51E1|nr:uncharacterized protein LOC111641935 [Centruroides sculpturatus]